MRVLLISRGPSLGYVPDCTLVSHHARVDSGIDNAHHIPYENVFLSTFDTIITQHWSKVLSLQDENACRGNLRP